MTFATFGCKVTIILRHMQILEQNSTKFVLFARKQVVLGQKKKKGHIFLSPKILARTRAIKILKKDKMK